MIEPTYYVLITVYYIALLTGFLCILLALAVSIINILNRLARRYEFLWKIAEYVYYREDFLEYFKDKRSATGRFNKK